MEEFTAYTVERIKGKKQLVFNISCDVVFNSFKTLKTGKLKILICKIVLVQTLKSCSITIFHILIQ